MSKESCLIVFPSKRQLNYLISTKQQNGIIYVILHKDYEGSPLTELNIFYITKDDRTHIEFLKGKNLKVICCHEESLFWVRLYKNDKWVFPFNPSYLSLFEKDSFKNFMKKEGNRLYINDNSYVALELYYDSYIYGSNASSCGFYVDSYFPTV